MSFNRKESAEWAQAADAGADKLQAGVDKALADSASRGFPTPPGETLGAILDMGIGTKTALVEANAKIYEDRRGVIFGQREFALKVLVRIAKLALEAYREALFNAIALEQAQAQAQAERSRADVERMNVDTELRQVALIRAKAELEAEINVYRRQALEAEYLTMDAEESLVNAQLQTAEKKLEIIDSIYEVLAAEQLVLAAEQRRAASLEKVMQAQEILAGIKQEMVPYYMDKAQAREELAVAITQEAAVKEDIERLGYDRLELRDAEEAAVHRIREATEDYELAQEARTRAEKAVELARTQARRVLQLYANEVRESVERDRVELEKDNINFRLEAAYKRALFRAENDISLTTHEILKILEELSNFISNFIQIAQSQDATVRASAVQIARSVTDAFTGLTIHKGFIAGFGSTATIDTES